MERGEWTRPASSEPETKRSRGVQLRRLRDTPSQVVADLAWQILDATTAVARTHPPRVATIAIRPTIFDGERVSGLYDGEHRQLILDDEHVRPLVSVLRAVATGGTRALPAPLLSAARDAAETTVHEGLHSSGPRGTSPIIEALTELMTVRNFRRIMRRVDLEALSDVPSPLRGGYPGLAAYLEEIARYAAARTGTGIDEVLADLQSQPDGRFVGERLCTLVGADSHQSAAMAREFDEQWAAVWATIRRRNELPAEQQVGIMLPLFDDGRRRGRSYVAALGA